MLWSVTVFLSVSMDMYEYVCVSLSVHKCVYVCACVPECVFLCVSPCLCVCMCMWVGVGLHVCVSMWWGIRAEAPDLSVLVFGMEAYVPQCITSPSHTLPPSRCPCGLD